MRKKYESPSWEIITFSAESMMMANTGCPSDMGCPENCSDDCTHCFYLVCQPEDVIIG